MGIVDTGGIFLINRDGKLLVAHPTNHPENFWSIPKGKVDSGEDFLTAALREMWEEVNIDFRDNDIIFHELTPKVFNNKRKRLNSFVIFEKENDSFDFSKFELKCNSKVQPEMGDFYEMDDFTWIDFNSEKHKLHHTQVECFDEIKALNGNEKI